MLHLRWLSLRLSRVAAVSCVAWILAVFPALDAPLVAQDPPADAAANANLRGLEKMLATAGLTPDDVHLPMDVMELIGQDEHRLPLFNYLARHPFLLDPTARADAETMVRDANSPEQMIAWGGRRLGMRVHRGVAWMPTLQRQIEKSKQPNALATVIADLFRDANEPLAEAEVAAIVAQISELPATVAEAAALIVLASRQAMEWRKLAFAELELAGFDVGEFFRDLAFDVDENADNADAESDGTAPDAAFARRRMRLNRLDLAYMLCAGEDVAKAVHLAGDALRAASETLRSESLAALRVRIETPIGAVIIGGTGPDTYAARDETLLILDLGGNDQYASGGANLSAQNGISVLLDVAGNDTYTAAGNAPNFGAGVLGIGILADLAGADSYTVAKSGLGAAVGGIGLLLDYGPGNDSFSADSFSQAAATFGVALLVNGGANGPENRDESGNESRTDDRYYAFRHSQAFAYVNGYAALVDLAGNDRYIADDETIKYPSPQSAQHNASMSQGAACGRRSDVYDGHSQAGGFALLADWDGDDHFTGGVFAQGVGYWYGMGFLFDRAGNDRFEAAWYGQGATAHFALSAFVDGGGNDHYTVSISQGLGNGRDFSISTFTDDAGDDTYIAADRSMGSGDIFGIGIFIDKAGNDDYSGVRGKNRHMGDGFAETEPGATLPVLTTLGLFLDSGAGTDRYPPQHAENMGDGKLWAGARKFPDSTRGREIGLGLDE